MNNGIYCESNGGNISISGGNSFAIWGRVIHKQIIIDLQFIFTVLSFFYPQTFLMQSSKHQTLTAKHSSSFPERSAPHPF